MYSLPPGAVPPFQPSYDQQRVYVTSLANIASSSPSKKNWSRRSNDDATATNPARKFFNRLLFRRRHDDNDVDIVDDSINIADSKRLQLSIIAEQGSVTTDREIYCCSTDEGDCVVSKMKKTAAFHLSEGNLNESLHTLNKCVAFQQKLNGKKSVEVADTFNMMGAIMANMGAEYNYRAMTAFEQALEIYQQQLGFGSEESAACLKNLYLLLHQQRIDIIAEDEDDETAISCHECYTCSEATRNPM
ncbi:hypothetical protein ACHAWT_007584 [Skeletonema menzelii]|mmetsp:Transcript_6184/g.10123  ORF Transcript_6184/g.10123 Transcript_6184/m.10123 type:complete len:246 (+) Transcript_6184:2-739(+)